MSVPMKKRLTKERRHQRNSRSYFDMIYKGSHYKIPKSIAEKYKVSSESNDPGNTQPIPATDVFASLHEEYTKAGALLQGLRHREDMTQVQFAKKIKVTQADLSKMENGKRAIGKEVAKRIATFFDVNYRLFLE